MAVLRPPVVLNWSAPAPVAVLLLPVVLSASAEEPAAVLPLLSAVLLSASAPIAVLLLPSLRLASALAPSAVLKPARPPSAARAVGESVKQARAKVMRRKPSRYGDQPAEFCTDELGTMRVRECIGVSFFSPGG